MRDATFVDTSALFAVADRSETNHTRATTEWIELLRAGRPLITTNYVLLESYSLVQRRLGIQALAVLAEQIVPPLTVLWLSAEDHAKALATVIAANRRHLSIVDCTSFAVMRELKIRRAFAFDEHFREQGFRTGLA